MDSSRWQCYQNCRECGYFSWRPVEKLQETKIVLFREGILLKMMRLRRNGVSSWTDRSVWDRCFSSAAGLQQHEVVGEDHCKDDYRVQWLGNLT